ncbi:MAG: hypothetical protein QF384_04240 [Alphaproteobacteria bacterium]|jgi:broad specificity phosphatase PhoE|nr:hypothetical protein [Alphaproteobacteria bacterium]MDP6829434.1 hypothetical protein [Alphaproteobacteria bacterium]MDP6873585.1 hypothetical protein [Alphaproteobacteria bacterium]
MSMAGQTTETETAQRSDTQDRLKALVADTNVNDDTFLATDYLNHFNEIVMLLEMVPDMPDILEEAKEWQPKSYAQHFQDSALSDSAITIEAYENAPAEFREPFDETIARMNAVVFKGIANIEAALDSRRPEELAAVAATTCRLLQRLVDVASAIIHGNTPKLEQDEIDDLLNG